VKDKLKGAWLVAKSSRTRGARRRGNPGADETPNPHAEGEAPKPEAPKPEAPAPAPAPAPQLSTKERAELRAAIDAAGIAGRIRGTGSELILTDGSPRGITMDKLPKIPAVMTTKADYDFIAGELKAGRSLDLELDVKNKFFAGPVQHKNVIADITGTEKPDEYVIVGGHLDSWDGAEGATDNGTGAATTLEAARLLAKSGLKPRRTIRFMLFSGEEQGLLGSRGYAKEHKDLLPKISCVLVHDGGTNYVSGIGLTKAMYPIVAPALEPLTNLDKDMPFVVKEVKSLPYGVGSDHDTFLGLGVPGFFWQQKGKQNYDHEHHTQFDTFEAAVPEYQKHSAITIAAAALAIANLDQLLPRDGILDRTGGGGRGQNRKMLGVQTDPESATIVDVVPDSRAEKAGLQEGDVITKIGDKAVTDGTSLRDAVQAAEGEVVIHFTRNGKEMTAKTVFEAPKPQKRWY
jgi:hypothetical protein